MRVESNNISAVHQSITIELCRDKNNRLQPWRPFHPPAAPKSHRSPVYHSVFDPCMRAVSLSRFHWRLRYGPNSENGEVQLLRHIFYYTNQKTHHSNAFYSDPATVERPTCSLFAVSIIYLPITVVVIMRIRANRHNWCCW